MEHESPRLKRLAYQSGHRGTKELDLIFGHFAARHLRDLTAEELNQYERLLDDVNEATLWDWLIGQAEPPAEFDTPLFRRIKMTTLAPE